MTRRGIQFQPGLTLDEFTSMYGSEDACREELARQRWPDGFTCPSCGGREYWALKSRPLYQCRRCRAQISLTAGTIMHSTKLPVRKWFQAFWLVGKAKNGVSSVELSRDLGVRQETAWYVKQKIMQTMLERENESTVLRGRVQADDAYVGGVLAGGKPGRGSENKVPFIAAVEVTDEGHPVRGQFQRVGNFSKGEVGRWGATRIEMGTTLVTDGFASFAVVNELLSKNERVVVPDRAKKAQHPKLLWVNTILGNLKSLLRGTYHAIRPKHVPRYLAEFQYRLNRRFHLPSMLGRLLHAAVRTPPMTYHLVTLGESAWPPAVDLTPAESPG